MALMDEYLGDMKEYQKAVDEGFQGTYEEFLRYKASGSFANGGKVYKRTPQQAERVAQRIRDNTPLKMDFFRHGTRSDDPARLKRIDDYVKEFEKDYGRKPTAKNIRTTLKEQRRVIPFYEAVYGELPKGRTQRVTNVQKDVVKILKDPKVIQKLNAGKFPTITDVTRITKLDPVLAETRLVDVAERLRDNPKYKTIADAYLDKPGVSSRDEIFGAKKGKRARVILENRFAKLMDLDQKLPSLRTNILRKIQSFIPELKGMLSVDEIAGITSSMRRGSGPYAIFGQILGSDFNTNIKGRGIDRFKGVIEKELVSLDKDDPKRIELQKKYNASVNEFENKANVDNPAKKVKGLKLSFEPPSKTVKNKKVYKQYKDLFDAHYEKYGYSFEVPADRDSIVDISEKLDNSNFQNTIKNRFKKLIGRGGKVGALVGLGTLAGTGFALADDEASKLISTPEVPIKYNDEIGAFVDPKTDDKVSQATLLDWAANNPMPTAAVASAPLLSKTVRKGTGKLLSGLLSALGTSAAGLTFAGATVKSNLDEGKNIVDATVDPLVGLELLYPEAVKRFGGKGLQNALGRALSFGRYGAMMTPVGAGITALGLGKMGIEALIDERERIKNMTPEELEIFRAEQEEQMGMSA